MKKAILSIIKIICRSCAVFWGALIIISVIVFSGCGKGRYGEVKQNVAPPSKFTSVVAGAEYSCALGSDSSVWCWGGINYDMFSRSGNRLPARVPDLQDVLQLAAGPMHMCALVREGQVKCWGSNNSAQLGLGRPPPMWIDKPAEIEWAKHADIILAGGNIGGYSCARENHILRCWGSLPICPHESNKSDLYLFDETAVTILGFEQATQISGGGSSLCGVFKDKTVRCCQGLFDDKKVAKVEGLGNVKKVAVGTHYACAITDDDNLFCWGANKFGQLGNGTTTDSARPGRVKGIGKVKDVALGEDHTCAVISDGTVKCWGKNTFGNLGDGTTKDERLLPTMVVGLSGMEAVAVGNYHSCALDVNGQLFCWGRSGGQSSGLLSEEALIPIQVDFNWQSSPILKINRKPESREEIAKILIPVLKKCDGINMAYISPQIDFGAWDTTNDYIVFLTTDARMDSAFGRCQRNLAQEILNNYGENIRLSIYSDKAEGVIVSVKECELFYDRKKQKTQDAPEKVEQ